MFILIIIKIFQIDTKVLLIIIAPFLPTLSFHSNKFFQSSFYRFDQTEKHFQKFAKFAKIIITEIHHNQTIQTVKAAVFSYAAGLRTVDWKCTQPLFVK